ncbi:MAG: phosphoglycerate mutase family protein [Flavobacteriaceae bacterium]|nr:phosphoglycerate mutase family protein [Flavobacteriaceae bacterium]
MTISAQQNTETTTFYLIRHAEKVRSNPTDKNPDLSERGVLRAENWKKVLKHISFDAVYSTNFTRTLKTAEPIAISEELEIKLYQPTKIDFNQFKQDTKGKNILIVGHSNTIPQFVNTLINQEKYPEIDDAEFSHLYIITIRENQISNLLLHIDF